MILSTRADAYIKNGQLDLAIKDLTAAISLQIGKQVILMNVGQFRTLYPEYKAASDEAIALKLNQTFFPNVKYEDFSQQFLQTNNGWALDTGIYLERSNAYLGAGDWHSAAVDFRRAESGALNFSNLRWGEVAQRQNDRFFIDLKTLDDARSVSTKVWVKKVQESGADAGQYSLQMYELIPGLLDQNACAQSRELWPKVGEGVNRGRRHIVGVFEPPLLHLRSDMPCLTIVFSN